MTRPLLLGHRGSRASRQLPENTLASFELCLQHGCDGFEFDVRASSDGVAVICHDPVVRGLEIEVTPANQLGLPTLEDVLQQFSHRAFLDIELKVIGLEPQIASALRKNPPQMGYVVSSFLPGALRGVRTLDPDVPLGLLHDASNGLRRPSGPSIDSAPASEVPVEWHIPHLRLVDQELINRVHAAGKRIMVWTVNGASEMQELAASGVDALISDDTELLVRTFP